MDLICRMQPGVARLAIYTAMKLIILYLLNQIGLIDNSQYMMFTIAEVCSVYKNEQYIIVILYCRTMNFCRSRFFIYCINYCKCLLTSAWNLQCVGCSKWLWKKYFGPYLQWMKIGQYTTTSMKHTFKQTSHLNKLILLSSISPTAVYWWIYAWEWCAQCYMEFWRNCI